MPDEQPVISAASEGSAMTRTIPASALGRPRVH
jgi:hypothetical protein